MYDTKLKVIPIILKGFWSKMKPPLVTLLTTLDILAHILKIISERNVVF